jgi:hypothetical protein
VLGPVGTLAVAREARTAVPRLEAEAARGEWFGRTSAERIRPASGGPVSSRG